MFIDFTKVELTAGKGGKGAVHFRRENLFRKEALTAVTAGGAAILSLNLTQTSIRCTMSATVRNTGQMRGVQGVVPVRLERMGRM